MKIILFVVSVISLPLYAGCIVGDVINHTTTCTVYLRNRIALAKVQASDLAQITHFDETIGEYIIFSVKERLDEGAICKQYQIKVDEYEKNVGNIRLTRSSNCDKDANFDVFMEEFSSIPIKRCIININVYDSDDVRLKIIDDSAKDEKQGTDESTKK